MEKMSQTQLQDGISPSIERSLQGMSLMAAGLLPRERNPMDSAEGLRDSGLHEEDLSSATALLLYQEGLQCLAQVTITAVHCSTSVPAAANAAPLLCHDDHAKCRGMQEKLCRA